jgi:Cof subfamily protein (haloacid dehalogenase superfamily)
LGEAEIMMKGKWIISDLDGTLLNSRQEITQTIKQRVRLFQVRGGLFTLATGRSLSSALPFIEELEIRVPVILYNGAKLYDPVRKIVFKEHFLPKLAFQHALNSYELTGREMGLDVLVFNQEQIYCSLITNTVKGYMQKDKVHIIEKSLSDMYQQLQNTTKIMFLGDFASINLFHTKCFAESGQFPDSVWHAVQSEPEILEILPPNVNKGTACLDLIDHLGLDIANFTAVGDNLNDIEMIKVLPQGVAVQNAHPILKEAADWVTCRSNDENAIVELFDQILYTDILV